MKRISCAVLALALFLSLLTAFAGCAKSGETEVTRGQWAKMLGEQFGMDEYVSEQSRYTDVSESSDFYPYVQSLADWGVLEADSSKRYRPDETARVSFGIETALCAAISGFDRSEAVSYAKENGLIDGDGYLDVEGKLTTQKAEKILTFAADLYLDETVEPVENIKIKDSVIDLSQKQNAVSPVRENEYTASGEEFRTLKTGDVVILPGDKTAPDGVAKRVAEVSEKADGSVVIKTEEPELDEVCEEMEIASTIIPKTEDIQLPDGVTLGSAASGMACVDDGIGAKSLVAKKSDRGLTRTESKGLNLTLNFNFTKGNMRLSSDWQSLLGGGENFSVGGEEAYSVRSGLDPKAGQLFSKTSVLPDRNLFGKDPYDNTEAIEEYKTGKLSLDELKKKLNLTKDQQEKEVASMTNKFSGGYEITGSLKIKNLYVSPDLKLKKVLGVPVGIKSFAVTVNYEVESSLSVKGKLNEELVICTCPVSIAPGVTSEVQVIAFADLNGEVSVKCSFSNKVKSEYADGMKKKTARQTSSASAEVALKADIGPAVKATVSLLGMKIVDAKVTAAIRFKGQIGLELSTEYAETEKDITITRKTTANMGVKIFVPILSLSIGGPGTFANKLNISASWTIIGEKKAISTSHSLFDMVIWEETQTIRKREEEAESGAESMSPIADGYLAVDSYFVSLEIGESRTIGISSVPKGYTKESLVFTVSDPAVAEVHNGTVTAKTAGSCVLTISTPDNVYSARCTINVEDEAGSFVPLNDVSL